MTNRATTQNSTYPVIDFSRCSLCGVCRVACANGAIYHETRPACDKCIKYCITMDVPCDVSRLAFDYQKCDACGACIEACPVGAISWSRKPHFGSAAKPLVVG